MSQDATQETTRIEQRRAPIRGTQSFVAVMSAIWKRPSLTGLELLWRWAIGIPVLAGCAWEASRLAPLFTSHIAALQAMTVFKPVDAATTISATLAALMPSLLSFLLWFAPLALVVRTVAAAVGRAAILRRIDPEAHPRRSTLFALFGLRTVALLLALSIWVWGARGANNYAITGPASRGQEPNVVLLCALVVFGTLALFFLWALSIWVLDAAATFAAVRGEGIGTSIRSALHTALLRPKLIEMNLVIGIVKVALIVLAMVFSACPLPFQSVESQTFLACWWAGVGVLYLIASDYFHVVRAAAALTLHRIYQQQ